MAPADKTLPFPSLTRSARLGAPAGSETRLSGQRHQGGRGLIDAEIAAEGDDVL